MSRSSLTKLATAARRKAVAVLAAMLLASAAISAAQTLTCAELLHHGLARQYVDRNLNSAITVYDRIATQCSQDRAIAAKASVQRSQAQARLAFEKTTRDYADVPDIAAAAR